MPITSEPSLNVLMWRIRVSGDSDTSARVLTGGLMNQMNHVAAIGLEPITALTRGIMRARHSPRQEGKGTLGEPLYRLSYTAVSTPALSAIVPGCCCVPTVIGVTTTPPAVFYNPFVPSPKRVAGLRGYLALSPYPTRTLGSESVKCAYGQSYSCTNRIDASHSTRSYVPWVGFEPTIVGELYRSPVRN